MKSATSLLESPKVRDMEIFSHTYNQLLMFEIMAFS